MKMFVLKMFLPAGEKKCIFKREKKNSSFGYKKKSAVAIS